MPSFADPVIYLSSTHFDVKAILDFIIKELVILVSTSKSNMRVDNM